MARGEHQDKTNYLLWPDAQVEVKPGLEEEQLHRMVGVHAPSTGQRVPQELVGLVNALL